MDFYTMDLTRIVSDIVECCRGAKDWERLEAKGEDLAVLARAAQKGRRPSQEHVDGIRGEILTRLSRQFPGETQGATKVLAKIAEEPGNADDGK